MSKTSPMQLIFLAGQNAECQVEAHFTCLLWLLLLTSIAVKRADFQQGLQPLRLQMTATALPGWFTASLLHTHLFGCDMTLFDPYVEI